MAALALLEHQAFLEGGVQQDLLGQLDHVESLENRELVVTLAKRVSQARMVLGVILGLQDHKGSLVTRAKKVTLDFLGLLEFLVVTALKERMESPEIVALRVHKVIPAHQDQ